MHQDDAKNNRYLKRLIGNFTRFLHPNDSFVLGHLICFLLFYKFQTTLFLSTSSRVIAGYSVKTSFDAIWIHAKDHEAKTKTNKEVPWLKINTINVKNKIKLK